MKLKAVLQELNRLKLRFGQGLNKFQKCRGIANGVKIGVICKLLPAKMFTVGDMLFEPVNSAIGVPLISLDMRESVCTDPWFDFSGCQKLFSRRAQ